MLTYDDVASFADSMTFELSRTSRHVAVLTIGSVVQEVFLNKYAWHAEECALRYYAGLRRQRNMRLYVARISENSKLSRPCQHCCALLKRFPKVRVFYSTEDGSFVEETRFDTRHISHRRLELGFCRQ
jgi:cytidine deaminase